MAPEVIKVPVDDGGEQAIPVFSFACLDPAGRGLRPSTPEVEILHIELNKDDEGLWRVDLPPSFLLAPGEEEDEAEDDFDKDLLDAFPGGVRKINPAKPAASMEEASAALERALGADSMLPLFALMDLEGDPGTACRGSGLAAKAWWNIHQPEALRHPVALGFHEVGKHGIAAFQFFSPREPGALDFRLFHFEKLKSGWLLIPGMRLSNSPAESQNALRLWADERKRNWKDSWQTAVLRENVRLGPIEDGKAVPEAEARELVNRWLKATHEGNVSALLEMVALTNEPGEAPRALRSLGYEISTAVRDAGRVSILFSEQGKTWTAVGVKSQSGGAATFPLYLTVSTAAGPRILIASDLFGDATSGRDRLNEAVLARLRNACSEEAIQELRGLISRFRNAIPR
jgi:hypothetical protein